jgi:hypothetical protein
LELTCFTRNALAEGFGAVVLSNDLVPGCFTDCVGRLEQLLGWIVEDARIKRHCSREMARDIARERKMSTTKD